MGGAYSCSGFKPSTVVAGAGKGILNIIGSGSYITDTNSNNLKLAQENASAKRAEFEARLASVQQFCDDIEKKKINKQLTLAEDNQKVINEQIEEKVETNSVLIYALYAFFLIIFIFLVT